jgi:hypothetical protein
MVFPHEHLLLRFNGHFGTSGSVADRWSVGLRLGYPTRAPAYDPVKLQTLVNAAQTVGNTMMAAAGVSAGTVAFLDYVTGAQIGVNGKYQPTAQVTVVSPPTPTAGAGTAVLPWNSAGVFSLRTNIPRGRASNGRCYWPALAVSITPATGRMGTATVTSRVSAFKTFLDGLNTAANAYDTGMRVCVGSAVGGGLLAQVITIRSDDRVDSIERRENQQPSAWQTATLA